SASRPTPRFSVRLLCGGTIAAVVVGRLRVLPHPPFGGFAAGFHSIEGALPPLRRESPLQLSQRGHSLIRTSLIARTAHRWSVCVAFAVLAALVYAGTAAALS